MLKEYVSADTERYGFSAVHFLFHVILERTGAALPLFKDIVFGTIAEGCAAL